MAAVLMFTFASPSFAASETSAKKVDLQTNAAEVTATKVDAKVNKLFDGSDYVTYLIKMKEQADPVAVSKIAQQKASAEKATPAIAKLSMRNAVVSSLRETASRTQYGLESYLKTAKASGAVKEYKSFFIVNALEVTSTKAVMEKIALRSEVAKILPNEERFLDKVDKTKQASPKLSAAPAASPAPAAAAPSSVEWNIAMVNAPQVWALGIDGTGTVVASLDTGVDYTHPALQRKWRGYDASGNVVHPELSWYDAHDGASLPTDSDGHGTHTMGTMVGSEANGTNQIGVAPGAKWIAVRIFNPSTTDAIILDGGQWLLAPVDSDGNLHPELAPDVVNNSWGGGPGLDEWFRPIVQAWRAAQIFPEFSAGNTTLTNPGGPGSVANPANYPESVATGAVDINGALASFSLRGPSPYGETKPEVSAPGVNVRSSVPGGYEGGWNGTSMAGPHTTAIAALLLQANHSLTVDQLEQILEETATPRTDATYPSTPNNGYGYGIVNAYSAVGSVISGLGTVSGKVSKAGDDTEAPVLEHTPLTEIYKGLDATLTAHVTDNVAVTQVEAFVKLKGTDNYVYLPLQRKSGDFKDGIYEAAIPAFLIDVPGLEYYLRVNDYGNNGFETAKYQVSVSNGITPGYFQDFETNFTGFTSGGTKNSWEWGVPTSGPNAAYSGQKLVATNLDGNYDASANAYLLAPPIDLTGSPNGAVLSFKHWFDFEKNYDFGDVYIASAESNFDFVRKLSFTGTSGGWKTQYLDLRPYAGQQIFLLFNLKTDGSGQKAGWYIDDLSLQAPDSAAPAAPTGLTGSADPAGNVTLNWNAVADDDFKEYAVYRSTTAGEGYQLLGTTTALTYTDPNTSNNTTYYYAVVARDYSGNESVKSNEVAVTIHTAVVLYSDNFDGDTDNGWTHSGTNDEWERGVPAAPGPASAVSAPNVWGTDLNDTYENSSEYSLVSPAIDLTQVSNALLAYQQWYEIETNYDAGYVEITTNDGATWSELGKFSHSTNGKQWSAATFDLHNYLGNTVKIRFRLKSDSSVKKAGWYIDNFQILGASAPASTASVAPDLDTSLKPKAEDKLPEFKIVRTTKDQFKPQQPSSGAGLESLPASASVTVVETGRSVQTDPATGKYNFTHVAGSFNLRAESYGYYPQTVPVTITDGGAATANFNLQAIPHGTLTGVVTDERSHQPIAGATVLVQEDAQVAPVRTNADGAFTLDVLEGTYTLSVSAQDYYSKTVTVTVPPNASTQADVSLKPFIGYPGEIGYDDGTAENARAFNAANNAWAVRMTPEKGAAQVSGALFRFWDTEWPVPGGTAFQYAVYDASGADGAPGRLLAGPFDATALRNGEWTHVTLPTPVAVQGDFYIVYIQTVANPNSPGLATDESGTNALRSWQRVSGAWSASPEDEGNYMIRAVVQYPVSAPVITSPTANAFTNQATVTVTGTIPANGATVNLYDGTELAGTGTVADGQFSIPATLHAGANTLTAEAQINGKLTDRSLPVVVTLDQTLPALTVATPTDGLKTDAEVVYVTGSVSDEFLDGLTVNGNAASIRANGTFSYRILVNAGDNVLTITAKDKAGNETTVTRTVHVDLDPPTISNIAPASDLHINAGQTVAISFDSEPGLHASFRIELPLAPSGKGRNETLLTETSPGHYEGSYTTPSTLVLDGGVIVVRVWDDAGNEVEAEAPGKLYVAAGQQNPPTNVDPIAVIRALDAAKQKKPVSFDGSLSRDVDGTIVSYAWTFSDGGSATGAGVDHRFNAPGTYTVTLTVTDNAGATNSITHTIVIQ